MGLNDLDNRGRIIFLRRFTEEIVLNSIKDEKLKEIIKAEKIKRKYFEQPAEKNKFESKIGSSVIFAKPKKETKHKRTIQPIKKVQPAQLSKSTQPGFKKSKVITKYNASKGRKSSIMPLPSSFQKSTPQAGGKNIGSMNIINDPLKKINSFINDRGVQRIEGPGAGKNILVKVRNNINTTKSILSEDEIKNIINHFSKKSMIPPINGVLKAAIDNMVISAVISDAGSRFIIEKKSPYALIE